MGDSLPCILHSRKAVISTTTFRRPEINIIVVSDNFIVSEVAHAGWCTLLSVPSSLFIKIAVPAQTKQALLNQILAYGNLKKRDPNGGLMLKKGIQNPCRKGEIR